MIKTWQSIHWTSNEHNFQTKAPNWMALFCILLFLTSSFQIMHCIAQIIITWTFGNSLDFWRENMKIEFCAPFEHFTTTISSKTEFWVKLNDFRALFIHAFPCIRWKAKLHLHLIFANLINIGLNMIKGWLALHI